MAGRACCDPLDRRSGHACFRARRVLRAGPASLTGEALARDGELTPAVVGDAARTGRYDSRDLKKVWHYIARFGAPELVGEGADHAQGAP